MDAHRYLNQRFIEDIDELMKGHEGMKEMFGGNTVNINQRFEQLEQNYSSIETTNINLTNSLTKLEEKFNRFVENHDTLQQNFTVLQSTNSSLAEKIKLLERNQEETRHELELTAFDLRKEMEEKAKLQKYFQELQAAKAKVNGQILFEKLFSLFIIQEVQENFTTINLSTSALQNRLEEEETQTEAHRKRITALENNLTQIDDLKLTTRLTEIENNEVDVQMKLQNLESADVFLQEAHRLLLIDSKF